MANGVQAEIDRRHLMDRIKHRYEGGIMRPHLCLVETPANDDRLNLRYQWLHSAGMGDFKLKPASDNEARMIHDLLKRGQIAPTFKDYYDGQHYRPLRAIEDVSWGERRDGSMVLFTLPDLPSLPDVVITADAEYDAAVREIKKRIQSGTAGYDRPFALSDRTEITPIAFGHDRVILNARQNLYQPRR